MTSAENKDFCRLRFLIVGGGLASLASALALKQAGHDVTIFERMPRLQQIGAGIQLSPNATRTLRSWGILDAVLKHAYQPRTSVFRSWHNGKVLAPFLPPSSYIEATYGAPYIVVHRADLLAVMVSAAEACGVTIRLGCNVTDVRLEDATVILSDGEYVSGDVILGADGERSYCRSVLAGRLDLPVPTDDVVARIAVSRNDILQDEKHPSWELMQPGSVNVWLGPDSHAVSYLLNNSNILNVVLIRKEPRRRPQDVMYGPQPVALQDLRESFDGWDPALRALIDVPGRSHCIKWTMLRINEVKHWRHQGGAPFCVLGDAAHAMPPYLAQGAAQAFEDAAALGSIFSKISSKDRIADALQTFESVRKPRVDKILELTLSRKDMYGMHDGEEQQLRDERLALGDDEESPDYQARPKFREWLWGYDAAADAAQAWEKVVQAASSTRQAV
ncbi:FAD binding domain-containing protein [Stachybotrys elegans]|uniref:FAD binding domain-containing protein n=1 Tax=Stachybotrys elegans TaxID=80388 RepID=A0A8K0SKG1_9HYPO|nr:FAD binding domain-containing protein [Stachybotrys elegans]